MLVYSKSIMQAQTTSLPAVFVILYNFTHTHTHSHQCGILFLTAFYYFFSFFFLWFVVFLVRYTYTSLSYSIFPYQNMFEYNFPKSICHHTQPYNTSQPFSENAAASVCVCVNIWSNILLKKEFLLFFVVYCAIGICIAHFMYVTYVRLPRQYSHLG